MLLPTMEATPRQESPVLVGDTPSTRRAGAAQSPATKEERLSALAVAQQRQESATQELGRLKAIMEDALGEEESAASLAGIKAEPDSYVDSQRPIFRKLAAAVKEEQEADAQVAALEQEIRDHSMSPADMLVEVRSLIRKQNEGFEKMRTENEALVRRVSELEAVVKALTSLPQLSSLAPLRPTSDFEFMGNRVAREAHQGGPTTLLHHATQLQLAPVVDYLLSSGITPKEQRALVLLNPPEQNRSYQIPKEADEASMLNQEASWAPCKKQEQGASWFQLDAGRKVQLMGWQLQIESPRPDVDVPGSFKISVSNDGETWSTDKELQLHVSISLGNDEAGKRRRFSCHLAHACIATTRYVRLTPEGSTTGMGCKQHGQCGNKAGIRFGLLILDDHGEFLVGPRRVRDPSPLHIAAKMGDTDQIDKLLRHGADLELLAECSKPQGAYGDFSPGKTPLQLAAASASLPAVQMLVDRGAKVHEDVFEVPQGKDGDLVAGLLQTHGSKPVKRIGA